MATILVSSFPPENQRVWEIVYYTRHREFYVHYDAWSATPLLPGVYRSSQRKGDSGGRPVFMPRKVEAALIAAAIRDGFLKYEVV